MNFDPSSYKVLKWCLAETTGQAGGRLFVSSSLRAGGEHRRDLRHRGADGSIQALGEGHCTRLQTRIQPLGNPHDFDGRSHAAGGFVKRQRSAKHFQVRPQQAHDSVWRELVTARRVRFRGALSPRKKPSGQRQSLTLPCFCSRYAGSARRDPLSRAPRRVTQALQPCRMSILALRGVFNGWHEPCERRRSRTVL